MFALAINSSVVNRLPVAIICVPSGYLSFYVKNCGFYNVLDRMIKSYYNIREHTESGYWDNAELFEGYDPEFTQISEIAQ